MTEAQNRIIHSLERLFAPVRMPEGGIPEAAGQKHMAVFMHAMLTGGSQMAMLEMCRLLRNIGYQPWILAIHDGVVSERFVQEGFPCCIIGQPENRDDIRTFFLEAFDAVWLNSAKCYYFAYFFVNTSMPVIWWVHETEAWLASFNGYFPHPQGLSDNIRFAAPAVPVLEAIQNLYQEEAVLLPLAIRDEKTSSGETLPQGSPAISGMSQPQGAVASAGQDSASGSQDSASAAQATATAPVRFFIPGTYMAIKGYDLMLKAIAMLPQAYRNRAQFTFCGFTYPDDEPYREGLRSIAEKMENVTMLGELSRDELYRHYAACDCVVAPSRVDSGPMTVIEAMMFEKLTIVSDAAGISRLMTDCVNGFVFPSDNAEELMKRIMLIIADKEALQPVAARGKQCYLEHFSPEVVEERLRELLLRKC